MPQREKGIERQIVIGAIVSTPYLSLIVDSYDKRYILSEHLKQIMEWCIGYYKHYNKAPNKNIQTIFERRAQNIADKDMLDNIEATLDNLSQDWEGLADEFDPKYLADKAIEYFKVRSFAVLAEELTSASENYDAQAGEEILQQYHKVESSMSKRVRPMEDDNLLELALNKTYEPLFRLPGALGRMMNSHLVPGGFISFMGPEKRGKSWYLMELAVRACKDHVPTVVFQAGDMDDADLTMRLAVRVCGRSDREKYCGEMLVPCLDCKHNQDDTCNLKDRTSKYGLVMPGEVEAEDKGKNSKNRRGRGDKDKQEKPKKQFYSPELIMEANPDYEPCSVCRTKKNFQGAQYWRVRPECNPITKAEIKEAFAKSKKLWRTTPIVLTYPTHTLTVSKMKQELDKLEREEGITARCIIVDYADILAAENTRLDFRHQQSAIWAGLRGLALERNALVATATQADAASYDQDTIELHNFSEDKRKYSYVTGIFGLNQTKEEKQLGRMRINTLLARNEDYSRLDTVTVIQCLQIGNPLIGSYSYTK